MMNNTSDTEGSVTNLNTPEARVATGILVAFSIVILFSLVGNSLVIAVVYQNLNQRMRSPTNFFVAAMAVGDELMTLINMIAHVVLVARNDRLHMNVSTAAIVCKGLSFFWIFLIAWSTGCLTAIALDWFFLVFYPLKSVITIRRAQVLFAVTLVTSALLAAPLSALYTAREDRGKVICVDAVAREGSLVYFTFFLSVFIFFPLLLLLVLYTAISAKLWLRPNPGNQQNRARLNRKAVKMMATIVVFFMMCWLPAVSMVLWCVSSENDCEIPEHIESALFFIAFSNSAINPYIYFVFNDDFRSGARAIVSSMRSRCMNMFGDRSQVAVNSVEINPVVTS